MKSSPKAPTYEINYSDLIFKYSLGKKTHMGYTTTRLQNLKNNFSKSKDHAKFLEIGMVTSN